MTTDTLVINKGFVRLVDMMGDDSSIVQAARVSYGDGTKTYREDKKLISYLWRNKHTSPFEMVEMKWHIKCPIYVARQWLRHRTANVNEVSGRYSVLPNEYHIPMLHTQHENKKQGRSDNLVEDHESFYVHAEMLCEQAYTMYEVLLGKGVAREIARTILPTAFYTEFYWKIDLHNFLKFLVQRMDKHAQVEIRDYAYALKALISGRLPTTMEVVFGNKD